MATKPENVFINSIKRNLPSSVYSMKNNNPFTAGIADVWYSSVGGDMWVEYKWLHKRPTNSFVPALTPLQVKWLRDRHTEGRRVYVVVGCPDGAVVLKNLEWESACTFDVIYSRKEVASWIEKETTICRLSAA
jgi:hypothetical protein